jgi:hypothetical protein
MSPLLARFVNYQQDTSVGKQSQAQCDQGYAYGIDLGRYTKNVNIALTLNV